MSSSCAWVEEKEGQGCCLSHHNDTQKPDMMVHACHPRTWEADAGQLLAQGQSGLLVR